ncbi:hypothetical protein ALC53_01729 [Atta colombica]|uniref:Uncharacterized protein n=2 Tax=Atta colombica TaxID=520822 RepID=A0A195BUS6_9HYME|nr:hypothetical protein ALC53_01729 [Atta colombica]
MKDLITKNQSTPVNTISNNKIHEYVINTVPNEHIDSINDQFILNKRLKPEEDNMEEKENLEDNKEKLEDNKNLGTSENTISESTASSSVSKKNENLSFSFYDFPSEETVFREDYEKEKPDSENISKSTSDIIV